MDNRLYKKLSKSERVLKSLLANLRGKRRYVRRPILSKKVNRVIEFVKEKLKREESK